MSLNCETGLESVIKSNNKLENNNIECSTNVPANQEPFKDSENQEDGYNQNKLNCVTCEKTLHEESSLVGHKRDTPDIKAWTHLENHAGGAHRNSRINLNHKNLQYSFACEICNNSRVDKTHPKNHIRKYHRAKMKAPEEADNIIINKGSRVLIISQKKLKIKD